MKLLTTGAVALGALLVTLVLCEGLLRVVHFSSLVATSDNPMWSWIVYDPLTLRRNKPDFVENDVHINSLGFRGDEITREKPPGTLRIVCIGDSTTFGIWREAPFVMRFTVNYPVALERRLRAGGDQHVEVINAGVLGYTTAEGLALYLTRILELHPDVITVRLGNNDHGLLGSTEVPPLAGEREYEIMSRIPGPAYRLDLTLLAFHAFRRLQAARPQPDASEKHVPLPQFERNLRRFVDQSRAHGVHIAFLDFPYRPLARGPTPDETLPNYFTDARTLEELHALHAQYQDVVVRVAQETGSPFIRTAEALRAAPTPVFSDWDLSHPTAEGGEIIAGVLAEALRTQGWLTPRDQTSGASPSERGSQRHAMSSTSTSDAADTFAARRLPGVVVKTSAMRSPGLARTRINPFRVGGRIRGRPGRPSTTVVQPTGNP
jgi:lysophospholipase L1-like esterase